MRHPKGSSVDMLREGGTDRILVEDEAWGCGARLDAGDAASLTLFFFMSRASVVDAADAVLLYPISSGVGGLQTARRMKSVGSEEFHRRRLPRLWRQRG
jgi:hypothetical protein